MNKSPLKTRGFKRFVRKLSYGVPRTRWLYRLCKMYVDNYHGDNNADMSINGELKFLRNALQPAPPAPVIFDVGANRGQWSKEVLALKPQAAIHCFEPSSLARKEFSHEEFPSNVVLNAAGLGDSAGTLKLYVHPGALELSSVYGSSESADVKVEEVPILTLDQYCLQHGITTIHYLKIDVEGHELAVLRGADATLKSGAINYIQFEYGSWYIYAGVFLRDLFQYIHKYNYKICKIMPWGLEPLQSYSPTLERFENAYYVLVQGDLAEKGL